MERDGKVEKEAVQLGTVLMEVDAPDEDSQAARLSQVVKNWKKNVRVTTGQPPDSGWRRLWEVQVGPHLDA